MEELRRIRERLRTIDEKMEIFVTLYYRHVGLPLQDYLELVDVVTLWGGPADIQNLESNLAKVEKYAPRQKKLQGCYIADYGKGEGLPLSLMKQQCETGLRWLKEGRTQGMIFLANTTADLGFECVDWAREWIEKVADTRI